MIRLLALLLLLSFTGCAYDKTDLNWRNGDVTLTGTLYTPKGDGPFPAAVFINGSGHVGRNRMARDHAAHLARRGMAVLIYDKRGCGDSGGDWKEADFDDLAADVLAILPRLAAEARIDGRRLGVIGISQGAWINLIVAGQSDDITFIVNLSGGAVTPLRQGQWIIEHRLRRAGHSADDIAAALAVDERITEVWRADAGWDELAALQERVATEPWYADAGLPFQPRSFWNWRWYRAIMDYDPMPAVRDLAVPMLFILSDSDPLIPSEEVRATVEAGAAGARGPRDVVMLTGLRHDLRASKGAAWPEAYWTALDDWLTRQALLSSE